MGDLWQELADCGRAMHEMQTVAAGEVHATADAGKVETLPGMSPDTPLVVPPLADIDHMTGFLPDSHGDPRMNVCRPGQIAASGGVDVVHLSELGGDNPVSIDAAADSTRI